MDVFLEKIVSKRKDIKDNAITAAVILAVIVLFFVLMNLMATYKEIGSFMLLIIAGLIYLAFRLITSRNVEFEYIVTNGDLDIDKIISKRKRKRLFSANCKDFDIVARVNGESFSRAAQSIKNRIDASSSPDSPDAYFITLSYKGEKTLVIFEPDERMLNNFKIFIPRKVLTN